MIEHYTGTEAEQIKYYQQMMSAIEAQIADARARGLDDNDEYIQKLQDSWWKYHDEIIDIQDDLADNAKDSIEKLIDYRIDMLKDERDKEKDVLKDKLSDLKDFYDKQKKLLKDAADDEKYLKEQSEKRKSVEDVRSELNQLEFDDSAWAQKRKNELKKELQDAEEELSEFEKEHALDLALDELDAQYEKQEAEINAQIDALDDLLNDPEALYNQALADIKKFSAATYLEMVEFNRKNGSGNDDDIKEMVENAYIATGLVGQSYKGASVGNYTGYTPETTGSWDTNKISDKGAPKSTSVSKSTSTSTSSAKSYPYGKASDTTGVLMNGSSGTGVKAIQYALNQLGYGNSGTSSVDGIYGSGTTSAVAKFQKAMGISADGRVGPDTRAKFKAKGYALGTFNATPGIHEVDELGAEYVFESKDGNRYRMFSGGEKVLDAKSTGFLYDFAKNGGKVLSDLIKSAFATGISGLSPASNSIEITVGDTIIQGNADQKTVSEIRRENRQSIDYILKEFTRLNR